MPRTFDLDIDVIGTRLMGRRLRAVGDRMIQAGPAFAAMVPAMEKGEIKHFASLKGKYVRTGDLKRSLTGEAPGSIRDVHDDGAGLTFGTSIYYAKYLTKSKRDPLAANFKKKGKAGWSAVLVLRPETRREIREIMHAWIVGDETAGTTNSGVGGAW